MFNQSLFELTNPQKSIWSLEQFYKNTSVNNIGGTLIIKEKIVYFTVKSTVHFSQVVAPCLASILNISALLALIGYSALAK